MAEISTLSMDEVIDDWLEDWEQVRCSCVLDAADGYIGEDGTFGIEDIADAMGMTHDTATASVRRATAKLLERLSDDVGEED